MNYFNSDCSVRCGACEGLPEESLKLLLLLQKPHLTAFFCGKLFRLGIASAVIYRNLYFSNFIKFFQSYAQKGEAARFALTTPAYKAANGA
jgi:hypothetical protein